MAPHSSTLAWKIPWMEEPGRLQSIGSLESDMTERLHFHFSLSCIGKGNSNPLQCSCLGNPRDGGVWWAAVYGVAQSRTRLTDFTFTFHFHALEKEMATHSSVHRHDTNVDGAHVVIGGSAAEPGRRVEGEPGRKSIAIRETCADRERVACVHVAKHPGWQRKAERQVLGSNLVRERLGEDRRIVRIQHHDCEDIGYRNAGGIGGGQLHIERSDIF